MIYFLVNNNYHMLDVNEHCKELVEYKKSLIQIPHTLDIITSNESFVNILTYETTFTGILNFFNIYKVKEKEREIKKSLNITSDDILFVYTEYEVLNQYIIYLFKKANAKVYIIEDGGFPTYLTFSVKNDDKLSFKQSVKKIYLNYFLGYDFVEFLKYNNIVFPLINEKFIDGVLLYLDVDIIRNIKKFIISKNQNKLSLDDDIAIFLNEDMYSHYCTKEEYIKILENILLNMSKKFKKVYFKFHPRETAENKQWQLKVINQLSKITVIEENMPVEILLEKYNAKYIFSFLSAALLNVNAMGVVPIYIYHLYPDISNNSVFKYISLILNKANYKFMKADFNINNVGFKTDIKNSSTFMLNNFIEDIKYMSDR